ncbi:flavodoxin domain-containing protein [Raineyella fluvialis]|uniref:Flavodoxin domain-containing protein n=1 Tax=Raineyella fluvialis TaxID=2662261 RepID=A0A5Q2FGP2_9ACTN|nr:flavodoxin domain-containing protein [Raineyella fluvialis]QGF23865.1 hypothetical protein Rai3103_09460 [Raineyella fluvialis]
MTNVLVAFATKGGTTQAIAERLGSGLTDAGHAVTVVPVQDDPDPAAYDAVVIGSGVMSGSVYASAGQWVSAHRKGLAHKPTGVFVVCLDIASGERSRIEQARDYPSQLVALLPEEPIGTTVFAGPHEPQWRARWERLAARVGRAPRGDFRDWGAVDDWGGELTGRL